MKTGLTLVRALVWPLLLVLPLVLAPVLLEAKGQRNRDHAKHGKHGNAAATAPRPQDRGEFKVYWSTNSISSDDAQADAPIRTRARVEKYDVIVWVQPALYISDKGTYETVYGAVFGKTNQPGRNVDQMRVGGALLRAQQCYADLGRFEQLDAGDDIVSRTSDAYWESDGPYDGIDDCWQQTGHNYFKIRFPNRPGTWQTSVSADKRVKM